MWTELGFCVVLLLSAMFVNVDRVGFCVVLYNLCNILIFEPYEYLWQKSFF